MFSLSLLILPSSFQQDSNKALFAENMQTALVRGGGGGGGGCGTEALGAQQMGKHVVPFCYSRAVKAHESNHWGTQAGREMGHTIHLCKSYSSS